MYDILLGGLSLFIMSIGMSVPLLLIGFSANRFLPKPGIWMVKVKKLIGFVLIGMSIYIIRPLLDEDIFYLLLNTLLTITIFYYLFFNFHHPNSRFWKKPISRKTNEQ